MSELLSARYLPRAVYFLAAIYTIVTIIFAFESFKSRCHFLLTRLLSLFSILKELQHPQRTWRIMGPRLRLELATILSQPPAKRQYRPNALCQVCKSTLQGSQLLFGSTLYLVRKAEFLDHHAALVELQDSADGFCHLCALLWHSVETAKRPGIVTGDKELTMQMQRLVAMPLRKETGKFYFPARFAFEVRHRYMESIAKSKRNSEAQRLRIKLWAQEMATNVLQMQLIRGVEAIGAPGTVYADDSLPDCRFQNVQLAQRNSSTKSIDHLGFIKEWIHDCLHSHDRCRRHRTPQRLPSRLVHVGSDDGTSIPHLHVVDNFSDRVEYLTLSHCWGAVKTLILTTATLEPFRSEIPWDQLPKTFQHALLITRKLGYSYIWIDSLCIMQDSKVDWQTESRLMGIVYAGSVCTIAATGSVDSRGGCFMDRDLRGLVDCTLVEARGGGGLRLCMCESLEISFDKQVNSSPLNSRGWVFQERLLSTRIVHFASKMVFWECQTCTISEQHPHSPKMPKNDSSERNSEEWTGISPTDVGSQRALNNQSVSPFGEQEPGDKDSSNAIEDFRTAFESLKRSSLHRTDHIQSHIFTRYWYELVTRYTLGRLTRSEDRLIAISGIAAEIQSRIGMGYTVGLWKEHLIYNLLWYADTPSRDKPNTHRAPSWSWASVDGMVKYGKEDDMSLYHCTRRATVLSVDVNQPSDSIMPEEITSSGLLQIRGVLRMIQRRFDTVQHNVSTGISYSVRDSSGQSRRFHPDSLSELWHRKIFCCELLHLSRQCERSNDVVQQTRGLVLLLVELRDGEKVFRRIGYFTSGMVYVSPFQFRDSTSGEEEVVTII